MISLRISSSTSGDASERPVLCGARFLFVVLAVSVAVISAGCGLLGGSASDGNTAATAAKDEAGKDSETTAEAKPEEASGPCNNPYYPIEPGVWKKYELTSKVKGGDTSMTLQQNAPEGDSFTETRTLDSGTTVKTPWKCTEDGIRIAEYENFIDTKTANFKMETLESSGTTIPASWKKGDEWKSDYRIKVNLNAGKVAAAADGTVTITNQLVSESEKVKVKGGEFDAARVDAEIGIVISLKGTTAPKQTIKISRWYSPKVGLVKQEVYGSFGNETMEYAGTASQ